MSRQYRWCKGANDIVIDAWYAPLRPHHGRTSRYSTLRWSGLSVMAPVPSARMRKAEDFHQRRNGGPTVGRPQAPERRATALNHCDGIACRIERM